MIAKQLSEQVLTVGCKYDPPRGGIAQVMYNYRQYVFPKFNCVINSGGKIKLAKLSYAIVGLLHMTIMLLFNRKIRIVHIHTASNNSFKRSAYFIKLAKMFDKKVIIHMHGGGFKQYYAGNPKWIQSILEQCDEIVALSEYWKNFYQSITSGVKTCVIDNIVAMPQPGVPLWNDGKFHLLFLGLIDEKKGIFDLINVLREHATEFENHLVLHIAGKGKIKELQSAIADLSGMVVYEGFVSGDRKTNLLFSCDAFILPSYIEGLPISILESMSYGKPILATPVGSIPEIIEHNKNGLLFQPGSKQEIYEAIKKVMTNPDLKYMFGEESTEVSKKFLPESVSRSLEKLYRSC